MVANNMRPLLHHLLLSFLLIPLQLYSCTVTTIVLVGATGDLAQKYLWQSIFDLVHGQSVGTGIHFHVYAAARQDPEPARKRLSEILSTIRCTQHANCDVILSDFRLGVRYVQLKTEEHYRELCTEVNDRQALKINYSDRQGEDQGVGGEGRNSRGDVEETGLLFYLSIPPTSLGNISSYISRHCRPKQSKAWMRVAFEKPFGRDVTSAAELERQLQEHLSEDETYLVDHYLGKTIVQSILPFRDQNPHLERMWNGNYIERVEIVLKETIDVQRRIHFYEETGVFRDVFQSHLTQLLVHTAMDRPPDLTEQTQTQTQVQELQYKLMQELYIASGKHVLTGQYQNYSDHVGKSTNTPTFAIARLHIRNPRWRNVVFLLVSGKMLDRRSSYIRVVFKRRRFCTITWSLCAQQPDEFVLFNIGHGELGRPGVTASKSLNVQLRHFDRYDAGERTIFGQRSDTLDSFIPRDTLPPYTALLRSIVNAEKSRFVESRSLLQSWQLWTPVLRAVARRLPTIYYHNCTNLAYTNDHGLHFDDVTPVDDVTDIQSSEIRGRPAFVGNTLSLVDKLTQDIFAGAEESIRDRGVFHLALPGGSSPIALMHRLSTFTDFPWLNTHIWQVDERCVVENDPRSNFLSLRRNLVDLVAEIPYGHIHRIPVHRHNLVSSSAPCDEVERSEVVYEMMLQRHLATGRLDYVVLGVGEDGHIASLLPQQTSLNQTKALVTKTNRGTSGAPVPRVTLTYRGIETGRRIAVMILGERKKGIVQVLHSSTTDKFAYPFLGLSPNATVTWYIDEDATTYKSKHGYENDPESQKSFESQTQTSTRSSAKTNDVTETIEKRKLRQPNSEL